MIHTVSRKQLRQLVLELVPQRHLRIQVAELMLADRVGGSQDV
jgi:hypothetical protein